jgi:hypothetical protein
MPYRHSSPLRDLVCQLSDGTVNIFFRSFHEHTPDLHEESFNSKLRYYLARLHKKTKCYSKSIEMLRFSILFFLIFKTFQTAWYGSKRRERKRRPPQSFGERLWHRSERRWQSFALLVVVLLSLLMNYDQPSRIFVASAVSIAPVARAPSP